jgi:methylmalonyl-CoA mutase, N-terminal domain
VTDTADPLGGSYFVESLTDEVEAAAWRYIEQIDERGGSVPAIEAGFMQDEIERASYEWTKAVDDGSKVIVSVNRFSEDEALPAEVFPIDPALERNQAQRLADLRARRDDAGVKAALEDVRSASRGSQNLLVPMREALKRLATLGEVSDILREEFGVYRPGA